MSRRQKSPLHPSALTINDLNPGRTVVRFNRHNGILGTHIVLERPVVRTEILVIAPRIEIMYVVTVPPNVKVLYRNALVVKLRDVATGRSEYWRVCDLGVVPYVHEFSPVNFVVDDKSRHLLPDPQPEVFPSAFIFAGPLRNEPPMEC